MFQAHRTMTTRNSLCGSQKCEIPILGQPPGRHFLCPVPRNCLTQPCQDATPSWEVMRD